MNQHRVSCVRLLRKKQDDQLVILVTVAAIVAVIAAMLTPLMKAMVSDGNCSKHGKTGSRDSDKTEHHNY